MAIKQIRKKGNIWLEKFVKFNDKKKTQFFEKEINIKKIEKRIKFEISKNQNFIEYSELGLNYLKKISKIIKKNTDITHHLNFDFYKKFINKIGGLDSELTSQKEFLLKMGIKQRAEIISQNQNFTKKAEIYYRLKRLIDEKEMGNLFKVMLIKNKKSKFKLGF